jgi:hypothetical protein
MTYSFGSISYAGGLGSDQGAGPISGVIEGTGVNFAFTGITGYNPSVDESKAQQWTRASDAAAWQRNSEYTVTGATETEIDTLSSVIYLVLDSSQSLSSTQIGQIRDAAKSFINSLYSQLIGFVPSGVSATAGSNSITVSWNPVPEVIHYRVYRATSSDGEYSYVSSPYSTFWTDSGVSPGTTYYYKVSAYNYTYGAGSQSSYASAGVKPAAPSGVSATVAGSSSITVSWNPVSGANGYTVYRSTDSNGEYAPVGENLPSSSASLTDTGLLSGTTYHYKVSAFNDNGEGSQTSAVSATTSGVPSSSGISDITYRISGTNSATVNIPVSSSGSHFIEIGYRKDGSNNSNSDCAWFKVLQ